MKRLFVVGTDTGVGKTYVTCALARRLRAAGAAVGIYKPVCSGARQGPAGDWIWEDIERAWAALHGEFGRELICPQRFRAPLAPNMAALAEGRRVDRALLRSGFERWQGILNPLPKPLLLIEGAGGWLSPVADEETIADLAQELAAPVLVIAPQRLGTINHTLLTVESIRRRKLPVAGVVLNCVDAAADPSASTNVAQIERLGSVPVLATIEYRGELLLDADDLEQWFDSTIPKC